MMIASRRAAWTSAAASMAVFMATGSVHAAPAAQTASVTYDTINAVIAVGGLGFAVLFVIAYIITRLPNTKGANDALIKIAENNSEALKLQREQFEADQKDKEEQRKIEREQLAARRLDDESRNKNIAGLIEQMSRQNERMHNSEAEQMRTIVEQNRVAAEEAAAKQKLAESIAAMNREDERHNQELETRMANIERDMTDVKNDIKSVKASVGPNAAVKLSAVETTLGRLTSEFHALVATIKDGKANEPLEANAHETPSDNPHPAGAADGTDAGADARPISGIDAGDNPQ